MFGWSKGALAEYVSVTEDALAVKPTNVSFAEAATIAMSGFTALQAHRVSRQCEGLRGDPFYDLYDLFNGRNFFQFSTPFWSE